jgi:hypothetical protein
MPSTSLEPLLTEEHVAEVLNVEPNSLKNARCTGRGDLATLPWIKVGKWVRYRPRDLEKWLAARQYQHEPLNLGGERPLPSVVARDVERMVECGAPPSRQRTRRP